MDGRMDVKAFLRIVAYINQKLKANVPFTLFSPNGLDDTRYFNAAVLSFLLIGHQISPFIKILSYKYLGCRGRLAQR